MKLCSIKDSPPIKRNEMLIKQNVWRKWMGFILTLSCSIFLIWLASQGGYQTQKVDLPPVVLYLTGGTSGFFSLIMLFHAKASMRPSNWLARFSSDQLIIKFRSHLNDHFSDEDKVVAVIPVQEIEWVRKYRDILSVPRKNGSKLEICYYLELKLEGKIDVTPLNDELRAERNRVPPKIGNSMSKHKHNPVTLHDSNRLRLDWTGISPGIKKTLKKISRNVSVKSDHTCKAPHWSELEGKDLEDRILHLISKGSTIDAISLVRARLGYDLSKAKGFIDDLEQK